MQRAAENDQHCFAIDGNLAYREVSQRLSSKKPSWIWNLVILVLVGLCGMYLCISGVERRVISGKSSTLVLNTSKSRARSFCQKRGSHVGRAFAVHYPQPLTYDRKECRCTPVHNFAIFSMQRSGSGWFETLLNSHPNVSSHGEIFSVDARRENWATIKQNLDTVYNLDWVSSAAKNECTAAVGVKWMLNQGLMEYKRQVAAYLQEHKVSVIFLFRRNILRRYVSILANTFDREAKQLNGTHRSHVHSKEEAIVLAAFKPVVNLTFLIPYLQRIEDIMNDAQASFNGARHIIVYYEDLAKYSKDLKRVQEFLGVETKKLESKHVKIHTRPLRDQVENWGDLTEWLKGTKYKDLLNGKDYR